MISLQHRHAFALLPVLLLLAGLEAWWLLRRDRSAFDWRESATSLAIGLGQKAIGLVTAGGVAALVFAAWEHRVFTIDMKAWWAIPALFVASEFCYYWQHRAAHAIRWFWTSHAVHHSPTHLNLSAAYRLGWTAQFTGGVLFFLPLPLLGFAPPTIGLILAANLLYQFWLHTELIPELGWFEWLFNTPSHHRVHHASNPEYLDANFGGVLIVFDRLFGTLVDENEDVPCRYGLVDPVASNNPLYIVAHEWIAMTRDVVHATRLADRIGYVLGRPGWRARDARQGPATAVAMTASANATTSTC